MQSYIMTIRLLIDEDAISSKCSGSFRFHEDESQLGSLCWTRRCETWISRGGKDAECPHLLIFGAFRKDLMSNEEEKSESKAEGDPL